MHTQHLFIEKLDKSLLLEFEINITEENMTSFKCAPQRLSLFLLALIVGAGGIGLLIISITLLPIFGYFMLIPVGCLAYYIFTLRLNDKCEIELSS